MFLCGFLLSEKETYGRKTPATKTTKEDFFAFFNDKVMSNKNRLVIITGTENPFRVDSVSLFFRKWWSSAWVVICAPFDSENDIHTLYVSILVKLIILPEKKRIK